MAEGTKCVLDLMSGFIPEAVLATAQWIEKNGQRIPGGCDVTPISPKDMGRISQLNTPSDVLALFRIPERILDLDRAAESLVLALDTVQDPGNLGTIIRVADWMGIRDILCSEETADIYNPKVVQSTMGALAHVEIHYCNLPDIIAALRKRVPDYPVYGTFLGGENIYKASLPGKGMIVMGNEGHGISDEVAALTDRRLTIPTFARGTTSESLNVAIATAITLSEFRRRNP